MEKKQKVKNMFDSISHRYDFLNHFLSAGIDIYWRKKAIKLTGMDKNSRLLDVASGTGDFAITAKRSGVKRITGADLSLNMLKRFNNKQDWIHGKILQTTAENLPFKNYSFTNITVAFGVRNFYDIPQSLKSFYRVLTEGGRVTILEFRLPKAHIMRKFYLFYFNKILPFIGRTVSKDKEAYKYLPDSVEEFDEKINLPALLKEAGFENIMIRSLSFGIVQVVIGEKSLKTKGR